MTQQKKLIGAIEFVVRLYKKPSTERRSVTSRYYGSKFSGSQQ